MATRSSRLYALLVETWYLCILLVQLFKTLLMGETKAWFFKLFTFTFTFMHLANTCIQSDLTLHCKLHIYILISSCFPWESNP